MNSKSSTGRLNSAMEAASERAALREMRYAPDPQSPYIMAVINQIGKAAKIVPCGRCDAPPFGDAVIIIARDISIRKLALQSGRISNFRRVNLHLLESTQPIPSQRHLNGTACPSSMGTQSGLCSNSD